MPRCPPPPAFTRPMNGLLLRNSTFTIDQVYVDQYIIRGVARDEHLNIVSNLTTLHSHSVMLLGGATIGAKNGRRHQGHQSWQHAQYQYTTFCNFLIVRSFLIPTAELSFWSKNTARSAWVIRFMADRSGESYPHNWAMAPDVCRTHMFHSTNAAIPGGRLKQTWEPNHKPGQSHPPPDCRRAATSATGCSRSR
jgi:hypothetical protein